MKYILQAIFQLSVGSLALWGLIKIGDWLFREPEEQKRERYRRALVEGYERGKAKWQKAEVVGHYDSEHWVTITHTSLGDCIVCPKCTNTVYVLEAIPL